MKPLFVAEVKLGSPFGFKSEKTFDYLFNLANTYGDWISIHTDPRWNGSWDMLREARNRTSKPILAKGIHSTDQDVDKAILCGANATLVVGRTPANSVIPYTWLEPIDFKNIIDVGVPVVLNKRNLSNGSMREIPSNLNIKSKVIYASFIKTISDVSDSCNGFIVGEHLEEFCKDLTLKRKLV